MDEGQEFRNVLEVKGLTTAKDRRNRTNGQKHNWIVSVH
jgi:hypothetical protein